MSNINRLLPPTVHIDVQPTPRPRSAESIAQENAAASNNLTSKIFWLIGLYVGYKFIKKVML